VNTPAIPPPYALREPKNLSDCESHGGDATLCEDILNAHVKSDIVLEWEWQPGNNWPGTPPTWINDINGYEIYEIDPSNNSQKYMKEVNPASLKVTALPLPWGARCYGVQAYAEGVQFGGIIFSDMVTYCPGQPPAMQQVFEEPSDWLTSGGEWFSQDCNLKTPFFSFDDHPVVLVGRYTTDYDGGCVRDGSYSGAVMFPVAPLPPGAVLQKALLRFSTLVMDYGAPFVPINIEPEACVSELGSSIQDWTGLGDANHYSHTELAGPAFYNPYSSLPGWFLSDTDVTAQVHVWLKYPENNHGFILIPMDPPYPTGGGTGKCLSGLGNFQLEIDFYAP
jgi:hypothetical protein